MTPIKRKLLYIFRDTLLRLRITWNHGVRLTLSVGYNIDKTDSKGKSKWDGTRCLRNTTHGVDKVPAARINKVLDKLEADIDDAFAYFEELDYMPTMQDLKMKIKGIVNPENKSIIDYYDDFLKDGEKVYQWAPNTLKKMRTLKRLLMMFNSSLPKETPLNFDTFGNEMLQNLMAFQTANSVSGQSENEINAGKQIIHYKGKYQNATINKNIANIKWFLSWASQKGYYNLDKIKDFKLKYKKTERPVIFLTWDELMKIYNYDLSKRKEMAKIRDMFCFCCFTSLRHSDMDNLKWGNVTDSSIKLVTQKTTSAITIDLNKYSKAILDRYRSETVTDEDYVFPRKSQQKVNLRLKQIAKECGIDSPVSFVELYGSERKEIIVPKYELITTHCGRRTFISNALALGIPPNVVMKWTGHSDYKAMLPYIAIADEIRKENMAKFDQI